MTAELVCWKCGAALDEIQLPLSRYAQCPACHAELHVCRMCRFFEPQWRRGCREPRAEEIMERERANFCEWLQPQPGVWQAGASTAEDARAQLDTLFGEKKDEGGVEPALSESSKPDRARTELEADVPSAGVRPSDNHLFILIFYDEGVWF